MSYEGIQGTTTAKIAAASGVSEGTIYRIFGSKQGLLAAALDAVYDHFFNVIAACKETEPLGRLREIGARHAAALVDTKNEHYASPLFDFFAAPATAGLSEAVAERQRLVLDLLVGIVEEGKADGSIAGHVDSRLVAWILVSIYWAEDIASLIGLPEFLLAGYSKTMTDMLLGYLAGHAESEAAG